MQNRKGFTLIELLIVVVIIGILAAIAIPKFANTKEKAVVAAMKSDLRNLVTAQEGFFSDNQDLRDRFRGDPGQRRSASPTCGGSVAFTPTTGNVLAISGTCTAAGWAATDLEPGRQEHLERRLRHLRGRSGHLRLGRGSGRHGQRGRAEVLLSRS